MAARRPTLSIGEFARRSRLSPKALRLYDRLGVLTPAAVDGGNGYRSYLESQLEVARLVVALRRLDMPLSRVAVVTAAPATERARLIEHYWAEVESRVAGQRHLTSHLVGRLRGEPGGVDMTTVAERRVAEQVVLTEQRHVPVQELSDFIAGALGRHHRVAHELGLETGRALAIYHGEVNEDSDGPVEICLPVRRGGADLSAHSTRVEPAHREAYLEITRAQVEFPQILSAYDAVAAWVEERGLTPVASPREVYVGTDFDALGPDDHACDIAFPVAG